MYNIIILLLKQLMFLLKDKFDSKLTGVAGVALTKIVRGGGRSGLEASTVLTIVVGTRTGLWIQHGCRGCSLAVSPCILRRALTLIIIYAINASSTVLQSKWII